MILATSTKSYGVNCGVLMSMCSTLSCSDKCLSGVMNHFSLRVTCCHYIGKKWKENFMLKRIMLATCLLFGCSSDASYPLVQGGSLNLTNPEKLIVINYWAVWCAPCRKEIPELNELASHYAETVTVVGVNFDGSQGQELLGEIEKLGIEFPSLVGDPRGVWGLEPVTILPETLIISPEGKLLHRLIGPQTLASIEALLE